MTAAAMKEETRKRIRSKVEAKLRPLTLPNFITLMRMAMVPFFVLAVSEKNYRLAMWILSLIHISEPTRLQV